MGKLVGIIIIIIAHPSVKSSVARICLPSHVPPPLHSTSSPPLLPLPLILVHRIPVSSPAKKRKSMLMLLLPLSLSIVSFYSRLLQHAHGSGWSVLLAVVLKHVFLTISAYLYAVFYVCVSKYYAHPNRVISQKQQQASLHSGRLAYLPTIYDHLVTYVAGDVRALLAVRASPPRLCSSTLNTCVHAYVYSRGRYVPSVSYFAVHLIYILSISTPPTYSHPHKNISPALQKRTRLAKEEQNDQQPSFGGEGWRGWNSETGSARSSS